MDGVIPLLSVFRLKGRPGPAGRFFNGGKSPTLVSLKTNTFGAWRLLRIASNRQQASFQTVSTTIYIAE